MNEVHKAAISKLILEYCKTHQLLRPGYRIHVGQIEILPVSEIHIDLGALSDDILEQSAIESFMEFDSRNPKRHSHTTKKILSVFKYISTNGNPTIGDIVRHGTANSTPYEFDRCWLRLRNFGPISLSYMDQWLASLGLKRIGTPPH